MQYSNETKNDWGDWPQFNGVDEIIPCATAPKAPVLVAKRENHSSRQARVETSNSVARARDKGYPPALSEHMQRKEQCPIRPSMGILDGVDEISSRYCHEECKSARRNDRGFIFEF